MCYLIPLVYPAGMFCSYPGLSQPTGLCQAGFYCPAGSTSPNGTAYQVLFSSFSFYSALWFTGHKSLKMWFFLSSDSGKCIYKNILQSHDWLTENIHLLLSCLGARHPFFSTLPDYALLINGFTLSPTIRRDFARHTQDILQSNFEVTTNFIEPISHLQLR